MSEHQVGSNSHSIPLTGASDQDLVYLAYLYQIPGGEIWFHVEVDTPDGGVFRGMYYDFNPNAMGIGNWYPTDALYSASMPGYLTITVQPDLPQPAGIAMTVRAAAYMPTAQ